MDAIKLAMARGDFDVRVENFVSERERKAKGYWTGVEIQDHIGLSSTAFQYQIKKGRVPKPDMRHGAKRFYSDETAQKIIAMYANKQAFRFETKGITIGNETQSIHSWAKDSRCLVGESTFKRRIEIGWEPLKALTTPPLIRKQLVTIGKEVKSIAAWARDPRCVVSEQSLRWRIAEGWEPRKALTTPSTPSTASRHKGLVIHGETKRIPTGPETHGVLWLKRLSSGGLPKAGNPSRL